MQAVDSDNLVEVMHHIAIPRFGPATHCRIPGCPRLPTTLIFGADKIKRRLMWNCIGMQGPVVPLPGMTNLCPVLLMRRNETVAPAFLVTKLNR